MARKLRWTRRALARLDPDEQALISIQGISRGNDQVNVVNEPGLYSLVLGSQRHSNQQPIPITSPSLLRLKGKPLSKGANVSYVLVYFDSDGKSLKKPSYDTQQRVLTLHYPASQLPVILQVLREQTLYCQFLSYANGHVWADLHTGAIRTR